MFEGRLSQAEVFKELMNGLDLVDSANFDCTSLGISMQAMDSSHVSLVTFQLKSDLFEHYRCDRDFSCGISIDSLTKILKTARNDDVLTIQTRADGDSILFLFENKKQTRISSYSLKLLNIDGEHLGIPDTDYTSVFKLPSTEFKRICSEISLIGETITISVTKLGIKFSTKGEIGNGSIICKRDINAEDEMETEEKQKSEKKDEISMSFAIRYLSAFTKPHSISKQVCLKLEKNVPLVVEYDISSGNSDHTENEFGYLRYYLAPKIDEDTEESKEKEVSEKEGNEKEN